MAFFDNIKNGVNKASLFVSNKTKDSMELSRLSSESRNVSAELDDLYAQIGRTFVDSDGDATEKLNTLRQRTLDLRERLEELEKEKLQRKNQNVCPSCGAVTAKDARFCSNCGARMQDVVITFTPDCEAPADPETEETRDDE